MPQFKAMSNCITKGKNGQLSLKYRRIPEKPQKRPFSGLAKGA
jgi:hypothetical protein